MSVQRPHTLLLPPRAPHRPTVVPPRPASSERRTARRALIGLLVFQGVSGLAGGGALVADPSGELLRLPIELIDDAPVITDYLLPGIALAGPLGLFALAAAWAVARRRAWAPTAAVLLGLMLTCFMVVEIVVTGPGVHWSQALYTAVGLGVLTLASTAATDSG